MKLLQRFVPSKFNLVYAMSYIYVILWFITAINEHVLNC